jgi:hypothetical protein
MKKLLTLSLVALMALTLALPAFAADATMLYVDDSSVIYKSVDGTLVPTADTRIKPGATLYIEVKADEANIPSKLANSTRVYTDWSVGKELVESAKIEYKRAKVTTGSGNWLFEGDAAELLALNESLFTNTDNYLADTYATLAELEAALELADAVGADTAAALAAFAQDSTTATKYIYVVAIATKSSFSVKEQDLCGTIRIGRNKTQAEGNGNFNADFTVGYGVMQADAGAVENSAPVVDFKNATDEIELVFGEVATFTVGVTNQNGKLYMGWNQKPVASIINNNPAANVEFLRFEADPMFNRIGELRIYSEDGGYLYEIGADGSLKALNATYNEDEEAFIYKTRTLSSYAFSDIELKAVEAPVEPTVPAEPTEPGVKPVPPTGAAA